MANLSVEAINLLVVLVRIVLKKTKPNENERELHRTPVAASARIPRIIIITFGKSRAWKSTREVTV